MSGLYGTSQLAAGTRAVRANTILMAGDIPEDMYGYRATPGTRSIAETLVHIAWLWSSDRILHEEARIQTVEGFDFPGLLKQSEGEEKKPRTKAEIIDFLTKEGEKFASFLEGLPESFLAERVAMPPGADPATKSRFEMLLSPKEHEMHHRGQLMVIQRMVGVVPHLTRAREEYMAAQAAQAAQAAR
jgi:uncharacterized damage-inducible protein DinB